MGPNDICPVCKNPIDTEICWCGDPIDFHSIGDGHTPVEIGCICHYHDFDWDTAYKNYLTELNLETIS